MLETPVPVVTHLGKALPRRYQTGWLVDHRYIAIGQQARHDKTRTKPLSIWFQDSGPPISLQEDFSESMPSSFSILQAIAILPLEFESAPYLLALVKSSCSNHRKRQCRLRPENDVRTLGRDTVAFRQTHTCDSCTHDVRQASADPFPLQDVMCTRQSSHTGFNFF